MTAAQIAACVPTLKAWASALTAAQNAVTSYATALTKAQQQLAAANQAGSSSSSGSGAAGASSTASRTASSSSAAGSGSSGSSGLSGSSGSTGSTGSTGSSASTAAADAAKNAKILSDQASITAAEQALTQAQANLDASTLTAPIGGVVGSVALTAGQSETSSSGITIVGTGAATITVPVPLTKLPSIKVGQTATVTPPGLGALKGTVSQIAMLPSSAANSSTVTYDVTVTLPDTPQTLATGTYAMTTITTAAVSNALTVPVSAVPGVSSGAAQVLLMKNGTASAATVTVGAVGGGLAEIREGLAAGDQVVIADVNSALPSNNSNLVRGLTGGPGGPPAGTGTTRLGGNGR